MPAQPRCLHVTSSHRHSTATHRQIRTPLFLSCSMCSKDFQCLRITSPHRHCTVTHRLSNQDAFVSVRLNVLKELSTGSTCSFHKLKHVHVKHIIVRISAHAEGYLPEVASPDPCTVTTLTSRQLLELLAAALHVPAIHTAHVVASGTLPSQTKGPQMESVWLQPLVSGHYPTCNTKTLLNVLFLQKETKREK